MMKKEVSLVMFEALVVGIGLVLIYEIVKAFVKPKERVNYSVLFISGVVFHLVFEYTGVNEWYSKKYCQLL